MYADGTITVPGRSYPQQTSCIQEEPHSALGNFSLLFERIKQAQQPWRGTSRPSSTRQHLRRLWRSSSSSSTYFFQVTIRTQEEPSSLHALFSHPLHRRGYGPLQCCRLITRCSRCLGPAVSRKLETLGCATRFCSCLAALRIIAGIFCRQSFMAQNPPGLSFSG